MSKKAGLLALPAPRSHVSFPWRTPSPQTGSLQALEQPSPSTVLASSHCSTPFSTKPSPQVALMQPLTQASLFEVFPSSHCSTPFSTKPSPHDAKKQVLKQPSVFEVLPSSHCSPGSSKPFPQVLNV